MTPVTKDPSPVIAAPADKQYAESGSRSDFLTLHEIVRAARPRVSRDVWDYLVGGVGTETTLCRNRFALDSLAFRPRVLRDVWEIDSTAAFFGRDVRLPVMLAPVGGLESFHPEGGAEVARGAADFGVPMMLSSVCAPGLEPLPRRPADARRISSTCAATSRSSTTA